MKRVLPALLLLMLLSAALAGDAARVAPADMANRHRLKRPEDIAPPEQIVVPRGASEYRPEGSLLSTAEHRPQQVDLDELHRRKLKLYAGRRVSESLPRADGAQNHAEAQTTSVDVRTEGGTAAAFVFWSFISLCVLLAAWLTTRTLLACRGH